jgi:hypothetical protein
MMRMMRLRNMNLRALMSLIIIILRAAGLILLCVGVYGLVRVDPFATMSSSIAAQGYIVAGLYTELAAVMVSAFQHRIGRIALAAMSVAFLEASFFWTSSQSIGYLFFNRFIGILALTTVGISYDLGTPYIIPIYLLDLVFLGALLIAFVSVFLLSSGGRLLAFLNSVWLCSALLFELSLLIYVFDRGEFNLHFTDLAPVWFTNFVLGISAIILLASVTAAEVYLRKNRGRTPALPE